MRKNCYILSPDGFDIDVLHNTKILYNRLGYNVYFGSNPFRCDLLVVLRGFKAALDMMHLPQYNKIHIYDYTGQDTASYANNFNSSSVLVISVSEASYVRCRVKNSDVIISPPYVDVEKWSYSEKKGRSFDPCHIGNFKLQSLGDVYLDKMVDYIKSGSVNVWGAGWERHIPKEKFHGHAYLSKVSYIYSNFCSALGIMHPFQRDVTFSSRFWFGPINGCTIISEPGLFVNNVPGVVETDYTKTNLNRVISQISSNTSNLTRVARQYWKNSGDELIKNLKPHVEGKSTVRIPFGKALNTKIHEIGYLYGKEVTRRLFGRK